MTAEPQRLLVVATAADGGKISKLLIDEGLVKPTIACGDDETLATFARLRPDVVVLAATLEAGDARSLAAAMRSGEQGHTSAIVLVGDRHGPVRNALDAADFEVDCFVGRPLSSRALSYAVRTSAAERVDLPEGDDGIVDREASPAETSRRIEAAMDEAIRLFVDDAMSMIPELVPAAPPRTASPAVVEAETEDAEPPTEETEGPPEERAKWRDPTLILGQKEARGEAPVRSGPAFKRAETPDFGWTLDGLDLGNASPVDVRSDGAEPSEAQTPAEVQPESQVSAASASPPSSDTDRPTVEKEPAPSRPSGGEFARELRRKMSAMAERLFPGKERQVVENVENQALHDAHTEIDLASLEVDQLPVADEEPLALRDADDSVRRGDSTGSVTSGTGSGSAASELGTGGEIDGESPSVGFIGDAGNDIGSVLSRLFEQDFTGRVSFRQPPVEKTILFQDGRPIFVVSNLDHDRMGDLLFREGKITLDQYHHCRAEALESGRRIGEVLVELGYLKPRELLPAVRRHLEDIIYSLFSWGAGEYVVEPGAVPDERIRLSKHPAALILEGIRRKWTIGQLREALGGPSAIVVAKQSELLGTIMGVADLSAVEREAVGLFDGSSSIEAVADKSGLDMQGVYQLAYGLVVLKAARLVERGDEGRDDQVRVRSSALVGETDLAIDRQRVLAKYAMVEEADYFSLLGVRRDATSFEIRRAHQAARRDFALENFPPALASELENEISEISLMIDEAYEVLGDDEIRRAYLGALRG